MLLVLALCMIHNVILTQKYSYKVNCNSCKIFFLLLSSKTDTIWCSNVVVKVCILIVRIWLSALHIGDWIFSPSTFLLNYFYYPHLTCIFETALYCIRVELEEKWFIDTIKVFWWTWYYSPTKSLVKRS